MLDDHLPSAVTRRRLRAGPTAPFADGFADWLASRHYKPMTVVPQLRLLARYSDWARDRGVEFGADAVSVLESFKCHLRRNGEFRRSSGKLNPLVTAASQFTIYLEEIGVATCTSRRPSISERYPILGEFEAWMMRRRGLRRSSCSVYQGLLAAMLEELGEDPGSYTAAVIRSFILRAGGRHGLARAKSLTTAVRTFLRFLAATGRCPTSLVDAVPSFATWSLAPIPRYLEPEDLERVISTCNSRTATGIRNRAVLLLLGRLGLRRSELSALTFDDIDWEGGRIAVAAGKTRRPEWLPLPQDVGEAILRYLRTARPSFDSNRVFCSAVAPLRPLSPQAVTNVAKAAIRRAGIECSSHGAHVLRRSAATAMLRHGTSLDGVMAVLRHRSPQMTALYAKVDFGLLSEIAQPWPQVTP